jgi:hypothetical protein
VNREPQLALLSPWVSGLKSPPYRAGRMSI